MGAIFLALVLLPAIAFASDESCKGVPLTYRDYLERLANAGDVDAQEELCTEDAAKVLRWGQDYPGNASAKPKKWCLEAAQQGSLSAVEMLEQIYYDVRASDYAEAYFWGQLNLQRPAATTYRLSEKSHLNSEQKAILDERVQAWKARYGIPKYRRKVTEDGKLLRRLINIDGLLCGGESENCKIADTCDDLVAINCRGYKGSLGPREYFFLNKETKKRVSECDISNYKDCGSFISKEWHCAWPKDSPVSEMLIRSHECRDIPDVALGKSEVAPSGLRAWIWSLWEGPKDKKRFLSLTKIQCGLDPHKSVLDHCGDIFMIRDELAVAFVAHPPPDTFFVDKNTNEVIGDNYHLPLAWSCGRLEGVGWGK